MVMMIVMINNIGDEGAFDWDFSTKSFSCTLLFCLINVYVVNIVFVGFLKITQSFPLSLFLVHFPSFLRQLDRLVSLFGVR